MTQVLSFQESGVGDLIAPMLQDSVMPILLVEDGQKITHANPAAEAILKDVSDLTALWTAVAEAPANGSDIVLPFGAARPARGFHLLFSTSPAAEGARLVLLMPNGDDPEKSQLTLLSQSLQAARNMAEVGTALCRYLPAIFPGSSGRCYLPNAASVWLEPAGTWGKPASGAPGIRAIDCWAIRRGLLHDVGFTEQIKPPCRHIGNENRSYICVPLRAKGAVLGILHLAFDRLPNASSDRMALTALARTMAEAASMGILRSGLSRLVESQSLHDLETGLYSRAFMIEMLAREVIRMTRARRSLTFAVVSPCHLDSIEQQFGSEARQIATSAFVEVLQAFRKGSDTASRIGPDSFALVLPEMDIPQAEKRLGTFLAAVHNIRTTCRGQPLPALGATVGAVVFPDHGMNATDLMSRAQSTHDRAQASGGDRVLVLPSDQSQTT